MPRTLVSFLGKFQRPAGGGYEQVVYRFDPGGGDVESEFFGWAAWQFLTQRDDPPTHWVILGTPTSSWDCLFAIFAGNLPDGLEEWSDQAAREIANGGITQPTLDAFAVFASHLDVPDLRLRIMPMESDAAFVALHQVLDEEARVILDITHAFRALPALALLAIGGLRWVKGVRIDDVLYGNLEGTPRGHVKDVVSLRGAARVAELAPSLARIALVDDFEEAEAVCKKLEIGNDQERLELRRQSILSAMLYPQEAVAQAGRLWQRLGNWPAAGGTMASVIGDWIRRATEAAGGGRGGIAIERRLVLQAEKFLARRDYLRCMLQLNEANRIMLATQLQMPRNESFKPLLQTLQEHTPHEEVVGDLQVLNRLRNHTAHGAGGGVGREANDLLQHPERIRKFLEKMLSRAQQAVNGTNFWEIIP
jgi:CRISPR-associated Csx2 family protein